MNKHEIQVRQKTDIVLAKSSKLKGLTNKILANRKSMAVAIKQGILERRPDLVKVVEKLHNIPKHDGLTNDLLQTYLASGAGSWVNLVDWEEEGAGSDAVKNPAYIIKDASCLGGIHVAYEKLPNQKFEMDYEQVVDTKSPVATALAMVHDVISFVGGVNLLEQIEDLGTYSSYDIKSAWEMVSKHCKIPLAMLRADDYVKENVQYCRLHSNQNLDWDLAYVTHVLHASDHRWTAWALVENPAIPENVKDEVFSDYVLYKNIKKVRIAKDESLPWSKDFIFENLDDIDINELCSNKAVPWNADLIQSLRYSVDWHRLSNNKGIVWDEELKATLGQDGWDWKLADAISTEGLSTGDSFLREHLDLIVASKEENTIKEVLWNIGCGEHSKVSVEYFQELLDQSSFEDEEDPECEKNLHWYACAAGSFKHTYPLKDLTFDEVNEIVTHVRGYGLALKDVSLAYEPVMDLGRTK
ncbi:hypothetical protein BBM25_10990 [Vibrio parahaemolyticus]|uniref:hypothetical protein n=1 Tax=Vibrio parahaemolyticus TaxID=670 RepID=UPI00084B10B0|nr:hypothetical protein [Vibrio parahaemolyticus]EGR1547588.1 hypothetical protein [Vibrio parahaemolyticus]EGR2218044.1 hypothetical protein [Vibrio parahaemolyticus]EJG0587444.1 hypothetical protein [Vibrio parahaemolyticus]ODY52432.1 hypothetical protein BBM25_10990 [Vibrio parahaemolyticus]